MAKLTHIDDVEKRKSLADDEEMRAVQEALRLAETRSVPARPAQQKEAEAAPAAGAVPQQQRSAEVQTDTTVEAQKTAHARNASQEEDFHGIDDGVPMGIGQKSLLVLAAIVAVCAVIYVVNTWVHFI